MGTVEVKAAAMADVIQAEVIHAQTHTHALKDTVEVEDLTEIIKERPKEPILEDPKEEDKTPQQAIL